VVVAYGCIPTPSRRHIYARGTLGGSVQAGSRSSTIVLVPLVQKNTHPAHGARSRPPAGLQDSRTRDERRVWNPVTQGFPAAAPHRLFDPSESSVRALLSFLHARHPYPLHCAAGPVEAGPVGTGLQELGRRSGTHNSCGLRGRVLSWDGGGAHGEGQVRVRGAPPAVRTEARWIVGSRRGSSTPSWFLCPLVLLRARALQH
jgi:hypothetical protein